MPKVSFLSIKSKMKNFFRIIPARHKGFTMVEIIVVIGVLSLVISSVTIFAIDSSRFFIDATSSVVDSQLVKDLVQKITAGYLKDTQVLEQSDKGRTVYCKVRTFINSEEVRAVILTEINRGQANDSPGIDQNRALKILSAKEVDDGTVEVVPVERR